ncbi:MAG: hypothetical protein EX272_03705 [Chromatiales bacterium]|nr:MAG: hypothetical protein EX272_03705 [Chromatiales bacterium]
MSDLEQLKELLFGAEKQALDSIAARVERREVRTTDVADVLPEAIYQSHQQGDDLVDSLTEPVGECLQQAFKDDPQTYGDALYPVMGPAIRKSIMHALRNFGQQINTAVEHSFTPRGLKWRWQASRAGVPFGEFLLQQTLQFRVEQAYLISRENGLLIAHVHHDAAKIKDSDAVSAMFTAIQDFVKESFSPDRTGRLESADMGDFTLWAVHGPHALLVCVIRGVPPKRLRGDLSAILERLHFRYGDAIRDYKGDTSTVPDVDDDLMRCLRFEAHVEPVSKNRKPLFWFIGLALIAAIAFFGYRSWLAERQLEQFSAALQATPGIHLTEISRDDGMIQLRGLRDPLAQTVAEVASQVDIPIDSVTAVMRPFQSLEPTLIEARARELFGTVDTIELHLVDDVLVVNGSAESEWLNDFQARYSQLAGVRAIDTRGVVNSAADRLRQRVAELDDKAFFFENGIEFATGQRDTFLAHAAALAELSDAARQNGFELTLAVHGTTDAIGSVESNRLLARQRAAAIGTMLTDAGLTVKDIEISVPTAGDQTVSDDGGRLARVALFLQETGAQE